MVNKDRITSEFMRQAAISSPSFKEKAIADYLENRLQGLGAVVEYDQAAEATGGEIGNMIARFSGSKEGPPLMLSVHMDTVGPCDIVEPVLNDGIVSSSGPTILGADDKAGIAEIIEALEVVREEGVQHVPLEVVVTIAEEVGLVGAKNLDFSLIQSRRGFAFDTPGVDFMVRQAPGANRMQIEITGLAAHAGVVPEKGLSAIKVSARAIELMKLGRIDDETTANIGTIEGGVATNIIPETVRLSGEARSHNPEKLALQTDHMLACFEQAADELAVAIDHKIIRARIDVDVVPDFPSMHVPENAEICQLARSATSALGREMHDRLGGGGSDANIFNGHNIEMVIIGTGMQNVHSTNESVSVDDMAQVAEFIVEVIKQA
jgi:tripeptide aminopeptidase